MTLPLELDTSLPTWRARAVRYLLIYIALVVALVSVRSGTSGVRPALREARDREGQLITQRDNLALQLQALENPQRVRDWAFANGMRRVADAPKDVQTFPVQKVNDAVPGMGAAQPTLEVRTEWK